MDRNKIRIATIDGIIDVALRKESVDRNRHEHCECILTRASLSARRAWIEIWSAVLTELLILSLSARRAWIEMALLELVPLTDPVALRKESVDRNHTKPRKNQSSGSRSPQGERG